MFDKSRCYIIAEAGVNHNGKLDLALKLCDAAKNSGADAVKFQTWKTENIITRNVEQAQYQIENTGVTESQFDMLKKIELPYDAFTKIKEHCDQIGITFISTADDSESLEFLVRLGIPFIKIGSGDIGNVSYLKEIGSKKLPILISTGMSNLADIDISLRALREGGASDITLLHCTTSYPCPHDKVNLKAMNTIGEAFHLPVGYSDHTIGPEASIAAVTMGACVIEKHFTLDCQMEGPDHLASTEPGPFKDMVESIRKTEALLGDGIKEPTPEEKEISKVVTKRVVAYANIAKGDTFTESNICVKRNDIGELARDYYKVIGRKALKDYIPDEGIEI